MAKQITKSYLEYLGVIDVTPDGKVFTKRGELKPMRTGSSKNNPTKQEKLKVMLYDSEKYKSVLKEKGTTGSGKVSIKVHQVVYAWFYGEIPYGKEIHHKDGNHLNNSKDNLVALTPTEHVKEHKRMRELKQQEAIVEEKCRLDIPREHYVKKIEEYMTKGDYANANQYKRRLKYYDNHIEEAAQKQKDIRDLEVLKYLRDTYRKEGHKQKWHMYCSLVKNWKSYDSKVKEEIMRCALGKMGQFGFKYE